MQFETRNIQYVPTNAELLVVTGLQANAEAIEALKADVAGTIGVHTFNGTTYNWTSTTGAVAGDFALRYNAGTLPDGTDEIVSYPKMNITDLVIEKKAYTAPVKQVYGIGFISTITGSTLGYSTVVVGDEAIIRITDRTEAGQLPYDNMLPFQEVAIAGDTVFTLLKRLVAQINNDASTQYEVYGGKRRYFAKLTDNLGAGTAFANSATVAAVKGATSLTTSAAHNVGVNDYVRLDGSLYQAITGTTGTTLVLDRPYEGATATIANAAALDLGATAPTNFGISITTENFGEVFAVATSGVLENASHNLITRYNLGNGSGAEIAFFEKVLSYKKGYSTRNMEGQDYYTAKPDLLANSAAFYTVYYIRSKTGETYRADQRKVNMMIAVAQADASTVSTLLDAVFGL